MSKKLLFDEESEDEDRVELKTNENYAKVYNDFRKKELLQKWKDKGLEEESSSDDDLSTDDEVENPEFDKEFLKTISYLVKKDPEKYKTAPKFFDNVKPVEEIIRDKLKTKEKSNKPVTIKDYKRELLLKHGPEFVEEDIEAPERAESPTYAEEQEKLKEEFKKVLQDSDDDDDGLLQKRDKTNEELQKEEDDYLAWLAGQKDIAPDEPAAKELKPLKEFWSSDKLSKEDQFLRDYILNKRYLDKDGDVPTYDEIVGTIEDEEELEKQEEFEHKYNHRFEEPDQEFLKRYPRTISDSVRAVDNKRKEKRKERQERKQLEKQQRKSELDELNRLKKQELEEKIEKLKLVAQNEKFALKEEDLESEFDPDEHDRRMREAFDDDYYQINEGDQKPEFPEVGDESDIEDWDKYQPGEDKYDGDDQDAAHCEDDDFIMDADYDPEEAKKVKKKLQDELIENTKSRRKKKKRLSKLAEIIKEKKPTFEPSEKSYEEYLDEYYKLDYEDIIDNIPCRFKYVETVPNDFGLSVEEILMATNKELNQWASLKKTLQKRPEDVEMTDYYKYKKRANNLELKKRIFKSIYGEQEDKELDENINQEIKAGKPEEAPEVAPEVSQPEIKQSKKKKKHKGVVSLDPKVAKESQETSISEIGAPLNRETPSEPTKKPDTAKDTTTGQTPSTKKGNKKRKSQAESPANTNPPNKKQKLDQPTPGFKKKPFNKSQKENGDKQSFQKKKIFKTSKRPNNFSTNQQVAPEQQISESRLRAFGIRPKVFYNKLKYGQKQNGQEQNKSVKDGSKKSFKKQPNQHGKGKKNFKPNNKSQS